MKNITKNITDITNVANVTIEEFAEKVRKEIEKTFKEEMEVSIQAVYKNNGVVLHGLRLNPGDGNVAPTIYLEAFWEMYNNGMTFRKVLEKIETVCRSGSPKEKLDMDFFRDFEQVKDRIAYKLINAERNRTLLEQIPHVCFLDLAICFYYSFSSPQLGNGTILIYNSHVETWKTNISQLMQLAQENTPRLFGTEWKSMEEIVAEMLGNEDLQKEETSMYVLSNRRRTYGAACALYPGLLPQLAEQIGGNLYILPSSVHELILLKENGQEDTRRLHQMIEEVNREAVSPEEYLSDALYYYDCTKKQIKIIF